MNLISNLFRSVVLTTFLGLMLAGCRDKNSPEPLTTQISGNWKWTKTFDENYNIIESASPSNSARIQIEDMPYGSGYLDVLKFYQNGKAVDSLYMPDTDNYNSSIQNEKSNELFVNYVDAQKKPAVARFKFFFPANKRSASRMEVNIQKNTNSYSAQADTVIVEYLRDPGL